VLFALVYLLLRRALRLAAGSASEGGVQVAVEK
jgi:hypothetical protein